MNDLNAPEYYRRREQQERSLARAATMPTIAEIHMELAERYAAVAVKAESNAVPARPKLFMG